MRLQPFKQVGDTPFSDRRGDVERRLGAPIRVALNAVGLRELDYGHSVFRFQEATGRLEEVTQHAPVLYLVTPAGIADLPFGALAAFVRAHDTGAFERAGFLVSPRFGLAFVPAEPDWVTALAAHCIDTWRALDGSGP